jgi:Spy/CpxP family protein refolding chaperone
MKKLPLLPLLALACAVPSARAGNTETDFPVAGYFAGQLAHRLDLTDAQRAELKSTLKTYQPRFAPLTDALRDEHQAWLAYSRDHSGDTAGLSAQADRVLAAQKNLMMETARLRDDLRKILTAEQLTKLDALRAENGGRFEKIRARFQAWLTQS